MDEATKKEIAVFRFGVIADIVGRKFARGEKEKIIREKASCRWEIPFSTRTRISRSTILSWARAYTKARNPESLYPEDRKDRGRPERSAEKALRRQRTGLSVPTARLCHGLSGHRAHPLQALYAPGPGQDRAVLPHASDAVFERLPRRDDPCGLE